MVKTSGWTTPSSYSALGELASHGPCCSGWENSPKSGQQV